MEETTLNEKFRIGQELFKQIEYSDLSSSDPIYQVCI